MSSSSSVRKGIGDIISRSNTEKEESLIVVTYATHSQAYFPCLVESCALFGYDLRVLGFGEKWRGYASRLHTMLSFFKEQRDDQIVMVVDGFDVIMCGPASEAVDAYKAMIGTRKMICGAFRGNRYTNGKLFDDRGTCDTVCTSTLTPYIFLCAGTWIVRARDGVQLLSALLPFDDADDDQLLLSRLRNQFGYRTVSIDCHARLFATVMPSPLDWLKLTCPPIDKSDQLRVVRDKNGVKRLYCGVTNSLPFVLHAPANVDIRPIARLLGIKAEPLPINKTWAVKKALYQTRNLLARMPFVLLAALAFFILLVIVVVLAVCLVRAKKKMAKKSRNTADAEEEESNAEKEQQRATRVEEQHSVG